MKDKIVQIIKSNSNVTEAAFYYKEEAATQILNTIIEEVEGLRKDLSKYEGVGADGGIDIQIDDKSDARNGDQLAYLAQYADDKGYNAALTDVINLLKGDK